MPRGVRAGNTLELRAAHRLEADGWTVGSRRKIAGPGDLLAVRGVIVDAETEDMPGLTEARLIEVKGTAGGPWERYGPHDRAALLALAFAIGSSAELWWWPPGASEFRVYLAAEFPTGGHGHPSR